MTDSSAYEAPRRPRGTNVPEGAVSEGGSVLGEFGQVTWSEEDAVSYEVALEGINQVIGAYSGLLGREEEAPAPDAAKVGEWREHKRAWAKRRQSLSPADPETVKAVRREAAALLADLSSRA